MAAPLPVFTGCGPCPSGFICPAEFIPCPVALPVPAGDVYGYALLIIWIIFVAAVALDIADKVRAREADGKRGFW